ncbi:MAG: transposase [Thermodesulfobacteriota bacterium]|nr:transposase [Thermodesulfobacteriota bacterium]
MPRISRAVAKNYPHHVIQRGNYRQPVFESKDDFIQYKLWFKEYSRYDLSIWAYCLMTNHVHIVCVPHKEDSLARGKWAKMGTDLFFI